MLNKIRNNVAHNKTVRVLLVVVASSMMFFGFSIPTNNTNDYAIKVGSVNISANEYYAAYKQAKNRIAQQFKGIELNEGLLKLMGIEHQVQASLIEKALVQDTANKLNLNISDQQVLSYLKQIPEFKKDGKFDIQTYKAVMHSINQEPKTYEQQIKNFLISDIVIKSVIGSVDVSKNELNSIVKYNQERRNADVLTISIADLEPIKSPNQKQLEKIYNENLENFTIPEKRDYDLLTVSAIDMVKGVEPTKEELTDYYNNNESEFVTKAQFKVQQILVKDKNKAEKLLQKPDLSKNFKKYVAEFSEDKLSKKKDGDMGWLTGDIFGADFESIVYSLEKNQVANKTLETGFGFHIFKLVDLKPETLKPFAQVKESVKTKLLSQKGEELLDEKLDTILDMVASGESLKTIAKQLNLKVQSFKQVAKTAHAVSYIDEIFSLNEGQVSQQLSLNSNDFGFVETTKITEQSHKTMQEVSKQLKNKFKAQARQEMLDKKAEEIFLAVEKGQTFKQAALNFKLESAVKSVMAIARSNNKGKIADHIAEEIFNAELNSLIDHTIKDNNTRLVIKVNDSFQTKATQEETTGIKQQLMAQKTSTLYNLFIQNAKKHVDIKINKALIQHILKQM